MILYVVRHGEATWNVLNKICGGQSDVPLTEKGRQQAAQLAQKMPFIDRVLCSPLQRARETASILMEGKRIVIKIEPRLREQTAERRLSSGRKKSLPAIFRTANPASRPPHGCTVSSMN